MKKIILVISVILSVSTNGFSQKPINLNPFSIEGMLSFNSLSTSFSAPGIKARYFLKDDLALRSTVSLMSSSEKLFHYELANNTGLEGYELNKISDNTLSLGIEKHLSGTSKLSPYFGLDLSLWFTNKNSNWLNYDGSGYTDDFMAKSKNPTNSFGLNLLAGTDYYFAENFFLGCEFGLGFNLKSSKAGSFEFTTGGTTTEQLTSPSSNFEFGNNFIGNIRVGWRF
jgi:outer membrane protein W